MTTREELRVVEALQALTGGLPVTEQDLLRATDRLKKSLEPRRPRRRKAIDDEKSAPDITTETASPHDQWDL